MKPRALQKQINGILREANANVAVTGAFPEVRQHVERDG